MSLSARALGALSSTSQSPARLSLRARCCMLSLPLVVIVLLVFIVPLHLLHRNRLQPTPRRDCSASVVCCFDFFFFIFRFALLRAPAQRPRASWSGAASVTSGDGSDGHRCGDGTAAAPQSIRRRHAPSAHPPAHPPRRRQLHECSSGASEGCSSSCDRIMCAVALPATAARCPQRRSLSVRLSVPRCPATADARAHGNRDRPETLAPPTTGAAAVSPYCHCSAAIRARPTHAAHRPPNSTARVPLLIASDE